MLCFIVILGFCYRINSWVELLLILAHITSPLIMSLWCDMNRQTLGTRYRSAHPYVIHTHTHTNTHAHTHKDLRKHANKCISALAKLKHWQALACWKTQRLVNYFHSVFFQAKMKWEHERLDKGIDKVTAKERWGEEWGQTKTIRLAEDLF